MLPRIDRIAYRFFTICVIRYDTNLTILLTEHSMPFHTVIRFYKHKGFLFSIARLIFLRYVSSFRAVQVTFPVEH